MAARWSSRARLRGLVRQPCADHRRCRVSTKSRPLLWRRKSSLAWPAHSHTETPRPICTRTVRPRERSTQIAHTSPFVDGPRALYSVANTRPVCGRRHTRVSHDTVPTPPRVRDGPPRKEGRSWTHHDATPPKCQMADARSANWHPARTAIGRFYSGRCMMWSPTRPAVGWSKASGTVASTWKPSERQRATARALLSTTALNCIAR